jgi:hypothetical protein
VGGPAAQVAELERHDVALLAYGSNACPGQLRRKLGDEVAPPPVVLPVEVHGIAVVFADLLAGYGSVPATVVAEPGTTAGSHVLLCSTAVADVIDLTEGGYRRLPLDPEVHPVRLAEGGVVVPACEAYVGVRGPLLDDGGAPVPLEALSQPRARALLAERRD